MKQKAKTAESLKLVVQHATEAFLARERGLRGSGGGGEGGGQKVGTKKPAFLTSSRSGVPPALASTHCLYVLILNADFRKSNSGGDK